MNKIKIFSILALVFVSVFFVGCLDKNKKTPINVNTPPPVVQKKVVTTTEDVPAENKTTTIKKDSKNVKELKNVSLSQDLVVSIYYASSKEDPDGLKPEDTYPSEVKISAGNREEVAKKALEMLISGPKEKEKENGLYSSIPTDTSVNYVKFKDNKVVADFSKNLNSGGGSFDMTQRRSQIENTLRSIYPDKNIEIAISVDGSEDQALQP